MVINISTVTLSQPENLKLHILLERDNQKKVTASVLEFPSFEVEASTEKQALEELQKMLSAYLENIEIIPVKIILSQRKTENPWLKFAGVFQDDPDFTEIAENIRAERNIHD